MPRNKIKYLGTHGPRKQVPAPALSAAQIRGARALLGIPQHQLAEILGVGHRTLAGWECGQQRCCGEICKHVLKEFYAKGVFFPSGGAGIEGKFKTGGRMKSQGDGAQLLRTAEPWVNTEVIVD